MPRRGCFRSFLWSFFFVLCFAGWRTRSGIFCGYNDIISSGCTSVHNHMLCRSSPNLLWTRWWNWRGKFSSVLFTLHSKESTCTYPVLQNKCPEESASFLSEILFWWITPFLFLGFKKPLTQDDMWKLNFRDRTSNVAPVFDKHWEREQTKAAVWVGNFIILFDDNECIFPHANMQELYLETVM